MKNFFLMKSIQAKIVIWASLCMLIPLAIVITFSVISLMDVSVTATENTASADAQNYGNQIKAELETPLDMVRSLAIALQELETSGELTPLSRDQVSSILNAVIERYPNYIGAYTLWEPNMFSGRDEIFVNSPGHDSTGRFMQYWTRGEDGKIMLETLTDYETAEWYNCPKRTGKECIVGPIEYTVQGKKTLMVSLVVPIMENGKFAGIIGIDYPLNSLQVLADSYQAFNQQANVFLVSYDGTLAAVKGQPELLGQPATALGEVFITEEELQHVRLGEAAENYSDRYMEVLRPIYLGEAGTPWSMIIAVPQAEIRKQGTTLMWQQIGSTSVLAIIVLVALWFLSRTIARPVQVLTGLVETASNGNLDVEVDIKSNDEVGTLAAAYGKMVRQIKQMLENEQEQRAYMENIVQDYVAFTAEVGKGNLAGRISLNGNAQKHDDPLVVLGESLNMMTGSLHTMIGQIREAANNLSTSTSEIMAATTQQASGSSEQSAAIAQTTTTVDEVKAIGEQAVQRAQEVVEAANRTVEVSRSGQQAVHDTIEIMAQIKERVEGIAENILALSEQTQQIGDIIATVSDIASQSNMLALNASVEAARAGEHGKGFAVVASEVRTLAEQSRQATAQIKSILQEIQKATNATVMATEEGTKVVDQGVRLAARSQESIKQLAEVIEESSQRAVQVVAGGRQQSSGVEQIAMAMQNINQAMVQSLASTRQAEQAAQNLNQLAQSLNESVKRYNL